MLCRYCTNLDFDRLMRIPPPSSLVSAPDSDHASPSTISTVSSSTTRDPRPRYLTDPNSQPPKPRGPGLSHHASYTELVASAESGCKLCALVKYQHELWAPEGKESLMKHEEGRTKEEKQIICRYDRFWDEIEWLQPRMPFETPGPRLDMRLAVYTTEDDRMAEQINAREIHSDVGTEACLKMAALWLECCSQNHADCPSRQARKLPTRVIDVGDLDTHPRLVISENLYGEWIALSYCWGNPPFLRTILDNLEDHQQGIDPAQIPKTIRDAVNITRSLGIRYLWIDSLCIIQDDPEDWTREATVMGNIYKNALVTIIAEASSDSHVGIFNGTNQARRVMFPSVVQVSCFSETHQLTGNLYCVRPFPTMSNGSYGDLQTSRGPVSNRAWTLQEDLLSFRVLRFSGEQMRWRCHSGEWTERYPLSSLLQTKRPSPTITWDISRSFRITSAANSQNLGFRGFGRSQIDLAMQQWYRLVSAFCERKISFAKDRIPAIAGLASEIQRLTGFLYIFGIWKEDIHTSLLWSTHVPGAIRPVDIKGKFPSWSWASVDFSVDLTKADESLFGRRGRVYDEDAFTSQSRISSTPTAEIDISHTFTPPTLEILAPVREICACQVPTAFFDCYTLPHASSTVLENEQGIFVPNLFQIAINESSVLPPFLLTSSLPAVECADVEHEKLCYVEIKRYFPDSPPRRITFLALVLRKLEKGRYERVGLATLRDDGVGSEWPRERVLVY